MFYVHIVRRVCDDDEQQCWEVATETADESDSEYVAVSASEFVSQLANRRLQLCDERLGSA